MRLVFGDVSRVWRLAALVTCRGRSLRETQQASREHSVNPLARYIITALEELKLGRRCSTLKDRRRCGAIHHRRGPGCNERIHRT